MYQFSVSPSQCMRIVMMFIENIVPNHQSENVMRPRIVIPTHPALANLLSSNEGCTKESHTKECCTVQCFLSSKEGTRCQLPGLMWSLNTLNSWMWTYINLAVPLSILPLSTPFPLPSSYPLPLLPPLPLPLPFSFPISFRLYKSFSYSLLFLSSL